MDTMFWNSGPLPAISLPMCKSPCPYTCACPSIVCLHPIFQSEDYTSEVLSPRSESWPEGIQVYVWWVLGIAQAWGLGCPSVSVRSLAISKKKKVGVGREGVGCDKDQGPDISLCHVSAQNSEHLETSIFKLYLPDCYKGICAKDNR